MAEPIFLVTNCRQPVPKPKKQTLIGVQLLWSSCRPYVSIRSGSARMLLIDLSSPQAEKRVDGTDRKGRISFTKQIDQTPSVKRLDRYLLGFKRTQNRATSQCAASLLFVAPQRAEFELLIRVDLIEG